MYPPRFPHSRRCSQSVWPLRTTVGVIRNLPFCYPTPPLTARDGAENECTNRKAEILQQTILVHIDTFQNWISPENINPSDLDNNADSDLSTKFTTKFQRPVFKLQDHIWNNWISWTLIIMTCETRIHYLLTPFIMIAILCDSKI